MHFDLTVTLGQIVTLVTLLLMGWRADRILSKYMYEHELLMQKYCDDVGLDINKLPTRIRR